MENILEKNDLLKLPKIGEIVEGKVIGKKSSSLFLDLGPIGTGIIYGKEFYETKDQLRDLKIGDKVYVKIIGLENEEGYIELSISGASREMAWQILQQKKEKEEIIKVKILGANKGGLLAKVFEIPAFLPASQLSPGHYPRVEDRETTKILRELQKFIGQELEVEIFDLDPKTGKLILSERAKESGTIKEILKSYKVGDIVEGEITGITDFGAFLKFGSKFGESDPGNQSLEGLIHISELDWKIIEDPAELVKIGQEVQAKIIDITDNRISLSLKALKKDPWQGIEEKYKKGDMVVGKVTKFNPFGAFVQIDGEIQGLCHISEFGKRSRMEEELEVGKEYQFQILEIRAKEHRLSLKLIRK